MKKFLAMMLVLLLALSFAGCGEEAAPAGEEQPTAQTVVEDNNILALMESANNFDALMEKYGKITFRAIGRDGGEYHVHLEENEDGYTYYTYDTTGVEYAATPQGQFIVTSDGESQAVLFTNDEEKETMQVGSVDAVRGSMYKYSGSEQVVSQEEKDGKIIVTTVVHMTEDVEGYLEFKSAWGIEDEEFDFYNDYILDKETLEIIENVTYCELSTGRVDSGQVTILYGQPYVISDELQSCMDNAK